MTLASATAWRVDPFSTSNWRRRIWPLSSGEPSLSLCSSFTSCFDMPSRLARCMICAGTSIPAIRNSPPAMTRQVRMNILPRSAMAGPMPIFPSPVISVSRSQTIQMPIAPSRPILAMDFINSIRPCAPNMRLRPEARFIFDALGAKAPGRKPSDPSKAGAAMAARKVASITPATGSAMPVSRSSPRWAGEKSVMSSRRKRSASTNMSDSESISDGPVTASQPMPAMTTIAVPSSRDWRMSPFLAASSSFFWVGFSVFSPPSLPPAMAIAPPRSCGPAQVRP